MPLVINTAPVELTTTEGYEEFIKSPLCNEHSTIFPDESSDEGYVYVDNEIVAVVRGEARDSLFSYTKSNIARNDAEAVALKTN
ncbi:hypothetical protein BN7_672 [Wickerhamomyces ciferrii]|uniref:Uncharacterized protein n=1 Tax=Wickerhamomyces ciferrii (strain ATCC 14091 / BCRC 22168 / CBS 111 / JCM 3599 / NBRC 0793 / NRRL Y-1031 F-60-10) TaxID=1206466 RepID=K0K8G3_WICCF|nr:uncharacterized protein BN7_672 [Wickerhamomyces ciferrii]CCH41135.1 hypothetical protein BN7_672 [Wickerhamomyces ciferrii]